MTSYLWPQHTHDLLVISTQHTHDTLVIETEYKHTTHPWHHTCDHPTTSTQHSHDPLVIQTAYKHTTNPWHHTRDHFYTAHSWPSRHRDSIQAHNTPMTPYLWPSDPLVIQTAYKSTTHPWHHTRDPFYTAHSWPSRHRDSIQAHYTPMTPYLWPSDPLVIQTAYKSTTHPWHHTRDHFYTAHSWPSRHRDSIQTHNTPILGGGFPSPAPLKNEVATFFIETNCSLRPAEWFELLHDIFDWGSGNLGFGTLGRFFPPRSLRFRFEVRTFFVVPICSFRRAEFFKLLLVKIGQVVQKLLIFVVLAWFPLWNCFWG
jgi:hypothetical protein